MFINKKEFKEMNERYSKLRTRVIDLEDKINSQTSIDIKIPVDDKYICYDNTKTVPITDVLENLIKTLGYKITYKHKREEEIYSFKKIKENSITKKEQ